MVEECLSDASVVYQAGHIVLSSVQLGLIGGQPGEGLGGCILGVSNHTRHIDITIENSEFDRQMRSGPEGIVLKGQYNGAQECVAALVRWNAAHEDCLLLCQRPSV